MNKPRPLEIAILIVIGLIVLALIPCRTDTTWVDPVTGSVKLQTGWQVYQRTPVIRTSALERWIVRHEGSYTPTWRWVSQSKRTILGQPLSIGCSEVPMYLLRAGDRNDRFVEASSETQITRFVQVMRTGSADEKLAAIRTAYGMESAGP